MKHNKFVELPNMLRIDKNDLWTTSGIYSGIWIRFDGKFLEDEQGVKWNPLLFDIHSEFIF